MKICMILGVFFGNVFVKKYLNCDWNEAIITAIIAAVIFSFFIYLIPSLDK